MPSNSDRDAYRSPPLATRFAPGKSGNPSGKKKGVKNFATEIAEELAAEIPIVAGGEKKSVSKQRALAMALVDAAIGGDLRATAIVLAVCDRQAAAAIQDSDETSVSDGFSAVRKLIRQKPTKTQTQ